MRRSIYHLIFMLLIFSSCKETIIEQLGLEEYSSMVGNVYTYDEFGHFIPDLEGVVVELEGSNPLLSVTTSSEGYYEIDEIPSGTYNLIISKEGYSDYQYQGIQIRGGEARRDLTTRLYQKTTSTISNFNVLVNDNHLTITGVLNHDFENPTYSYCPHLHYYISDLSNVSNTNYDYSNVNYFLGETGTEFEYQFNITNKYSSGTTVYVVAYLRGPAYSTYLSIDPTEVIITTLGDPTEILNITIP